MLISAGAAASCGGDGSWLASEGAAALRRALWEAIRGPAARAPRTGRAQPTCSRHPSPTTMPASTSPQRSTWLSPSCAGAGAGRKRSRTARGSSPVHTPAHTGPEVLDPIQA
eukprot:scaffold18197_cov122-Isochrysis_galbana.AAC.2